MAWINDIIVEIPDAKRKMLKLFFDDQAYPNLIKIRTGRDCSSGFSDMKFTDSGPKHLVMPFWRPSDGDV